MKRICKMNFPRTFLFAIAGILIGVSVYSWNASNVVGNKLPMPFGYGMSVVLSGSMEPEISVNDLVIIKETNQVKENDIIVFQADNMLVIHRVIDVDGDTITTKGDANNMADDPISVEDVKGKLLVTIPAMGSIVQLLKRPAVLCIVLVLIFLLAELFFQKEKNKGNDELTEIQKEIIKLREEMKEKENE